MRQMAPLIFALTVIVIFGLIQFVLLRFLNRNWWRIRPIRLISLMLLALGPVGVIVWFIGYYYKNDTLILSGGTTSATVLIILIGLIFSLPIAAIFNYFYRRLQKKAAGRSAVAATGINSGRRKFLAAAAAAFPVLALSAGAGGVSRSYSDTRIERLPLRFENLPEPLNGLKVLHITDSHLGIYRNISDFEQVITDASEFSPDLVLLTGDIADDLNQLPDALRLASSLNAPLGTFAIPGNHEYYRGIDDVRRIYDRSPVPLLIGAGATVEHRGAALHIAGADDPRRMRVDNTSFLRQTVLSALDGAPDKSFKILMSHRPEGFDIAAENGLPLTLAGHTHGGQVGLGGRSFFENFMPDRYLWGHYEKDGARMYLSAGIGHWFPFRLGCPPEAPIIVLSK